jgi:hypothetical protein
VTAVLASSADLSSFLALTAEPADLLGTIVAEAGFHAVPEKNIAHGTPTLPKRKALVSPKMHPDEIDIDGSLVHRLLAKQFSHWAHLPIAKVQSAGTDNAIYRLGDDMAVRLPRLPRAAESLAKELHWLPRLAPQLPLATPAPLASGDPDEAFPYHWAVYRWLPDKLADQPDIDLPDTAVRLGGSSRH